MTESRNLEFKVCLFIDHAGEKEEEDMGHSIYLIQPSVDTNANYQKRPVDDISLFLDYESIISPALTFPAFPDKAMSSFLIEPAMCNLGSMIYFFGGGSYPDVHGPGPYHTDDFKLIVRVLDADHPHLGLRSVASMNAPKHKPCVFVADNFIYALGSAPPNSYGVAITGCFERYNPNSDTWQVLPDPPPLHVDIYPERHSNTCDSTMWCDCATVVGRNVLVGQSDCPINIFNLDTQQWDDRPTSSHFPYGSLYVDGALYFLRSEYRLSKSGIEYNRLHLRYHLPKEMWNLNPYERNKALDVVKIRNKQEWSSSSLSECEGECEVMAREEELDELTFFTADYNFYSPWRQIYHLGGRFFCYLVTAQLVDYKPIAGGLYEPCNRGIWIKVFEEVQTHLQDKTEFRSVASFCYKIRTSFENNEDFIRCCIFGVNLPQC